MLLLHYHIFTWYVWERKPHAQLQHSNRAALLRGDLWMGCQMNDKLGVALVTWITLLNFRARIKPSVRRGKHEQVSGYIRNAAMVDLNVCKICILPHARFCFGLNVNVCDWLFVTIKTSALNDNMVKWNFLTRSLSSHAFTQIMLHCGTSLKNKIKLFRKKRSLKTNQSHVSDLALGQKPKSYKCLTLKSGSHIRLLPQIRF